MTEKLYYEDSYLKTFEAEVISCREAKHGYEIVLDRSAFYPEGGGQPGDTGILLAGDRRIAVRDTHEKGEEILHYTDEPILTGSAVKGEIDWERRFDFCQNHSGEHIVSGLIHERFGYSNVGFHMGKDATTIDFDGEFTVEDMMEFEAKANAVVWKNEPVQIDFYGEEDVKDIKYRSKKELHGTVRIVTFLGADVCACCGTHVKRTGEIGLIKLISLQKFKGGVRMEMLCGRKALEYVAAICGQNSKISVALSAKPMETAAAVERMKTALSVAQYRVTELENQALETMAETYKGDGGCVIFEEGLSAEGVRKLAARLTEVNTGRCLVFSGDEADGYKYAIGEEGGDLRDLVKSMNQSLNGRGGGKPFFVQGSVKAGRSQIEEWLKNYTG